MSPTKCLKQLQLNFLTAKRKKNDTQNTPNDKPVLQQQAQSTSGNKNVSSPYSTEGGGNYFGQQVQAEIGTIPAKRLKQSQLNFSAGKRKKNDTTTSTNPKNDTTTSTNPKNDTQNTASDKPVLRQQAQTTSGAKNVPTPYSTEGGGYYFEQKVQAFFLAYYLMDGVFHIVRKGGCYKIQLQSRRHGYQTDGLTLYFNDKNQQSSKLLIQVKHKITFVKSEKQTTEALEQAWLNFRKSENFKPEQDRITFITGPLSQTLIDHVCPIFEWARTSNTEQDFINRFENATEKREKLDVFRSTITNISKTAVSDRDLWQFLKVLDLMGYDFDNLQGQNTTNVLKHFKESLKDSSVKNCKRVWDQICACVGEFNFPSGTITQETLPKDLQELFRRKFAGLEWELPYFDSKNFVGNQHYLDEIVQKLNGSKDGRVIVPIIGLVGVGKTYLALKTVTDLSRNYSCIAWFNAHRQESLKEQFLEFGIKNDIISESFDTSITVKLKQINSWFTWHQNTLLIFDNAKSKSALKQFLPENAHIMITSLNANDWPNRIQIDPMKKEDATAVLKGEANISDTFQDHDIYDLVETLGRLPLAVAQAGVYIGVKNIKVSTYKERYEETKRSMLKDEKLYNKRKEHRPVYITFKIAINDVEKSLPSASDALSYCAYFNSEDILKQLLNKALSDFTSCNAVAMLRKYSLVKTNGNFISVHCVVQDVVREKLAVEGLSVEWILKVLRLFNEFFHYDRNNKDALRTVKLLIPHMICGKKLASQSSSLVRFKQELGNVCYKIGIFYLDYQYNNKKAKQYLKEAKDYSQDPELDKKCDRYLFKACYKNKNSDEAKEYLAKFSLAEVIDIDFLCDIGNYYRLHGSLREKTLPDNAKDCFDKALKIAISKQDDEKIAMVKHYLGTLYRKLGNEQYSMSKDNQNRKASDTSSRHGLDTSQRKRQKQGNKNRKVSDTSFREPKRRRNKSSQEFYQKSCQYYQESLDLKEKNSSKNQREIARTKHQLGITQLKLTLFLDAKVNLKEAYDQSVSFYGTSYRKDIVDIRFYLGEVCFKLRELVESRHHLEESLKLLENLQEQNLKFLKKIERRLQHVMSWQNNSLHRYFKRKDDRR